MKGKISTIFKDDMHQGIRSPDVKRLQKLLNSDPATRLQAMPGDPGSFGNETDMFGPLTAEAVQKFQIKHGIVEIGPKTRETIREVFDRPARSVSQTKTGSKWSAPVPREYFSVSQPYMNYDRDLYPKFGYHTGTDYGGRMQSGIPVYACADGEIIFRDVADSPWGAFLGNHLVLYSPEVDKSFTYCHLAKTPRAKGAVSAGEQIGIMGNTGKSAKNAIHLHLQGYHSRFKASWRKFNSLDEIKTRTFDAHEFICARL